MTKKLKSQKKVQSGAVPPSKHPFWSNFLRYYLVTCIFVGACFWFVPTQPLVPAEADVAKIAIHHVAAGTEASGIVAQTEQKSDAYEYTADDAEFTQIMDVLKDRSCRRTFRGLFGSNKLEGKGGLGYSQQIILYDENGGLLSYMSCNGNGKLLKFRVHQMGKTGQREMMEALRIIYGG